MENIKTDELKSVGSDTLAREATKLLIEKKALGVRLYKVTDVTSITDYYLNVTGRSSTQVSALADELMDKLSMRGKDALRVEGKRGGAWVLVDYGELIVNVFDKESRDFYDFDRLLPADTEIDISDLVSEVDKKFELNKAEDI